MINLSWKTRKLPTKKRKKMDNEQAKKTIARKRYLKSVRYCQKCGKGVYPDKEGRYPLFKLEYEWYGIPLLVCKSCKIKAKKERDRVYSRSGK